VYARKVNGRTLTFGVSGKLWKRSLVMYDKETGSLWSHHLGRSMQGSLKGAELEMLVSVITDWASWKNKHPDTTVVMLPRTSRNFRTNFYRDPSAFVLGYASGDKARAWRFDYLRKQPVVNDQFDGTPLLVTFEASSSAPYLFDRTVDGKPLVFEYRNRGLVDKQTGSEWDHATGKCLRGPLQGKQLKPLPGIISFRRAWDSFHSNSAYWRP